MRTTRALTDAAHSPFGSLYVFAVAARHRSFTAAAAELHRTQSAVSHRIKSLEQELRVKLFRRLPRRLELTVAGRALARRLDEAMTGVAIFYCPKAAAHDRPLWVDSTD